MSREARTIHFMEDKMNEFLNLLQSQIETAEEIGNKIENGENYMEEIRGFLPQLKQLITELFQVIQIPDSTLEIDSGFVTQVLNDILYGVENQDSVFLLDVLRYGLLELYYYIGTELQRGENHE